MKKANLIFIILLMYVNQVDAITFTSDTIIGTDDTTYDGQDITVDGCTLTVNGTHIFNSLTLTNSAKLTHSANTVSQVYKV